MPSIHDIYPDVYMSPTDLDRKEKIFVIERAALKKVFNFALVKKNRKSFYTSKTKKQSWSSTKRRPPLSPDISNPTTTQRGLAAK